MKKTILLVIGAIVLIALLAGGAFTAVQLMAQDASPEEGGVMVFEDVIDNGSGPVTIRTIVEPSSLLPNEPAAAGGILTRREDNSLFIGTGSTSVNVEIIGGETSVSTDHSGPELEVVIGRDTVVYRDVTEVDLTATEDVERRLEQKIEPAELPEDLQNGTSITVWGTRSGDRITADVVVFGEENG